MMLVDCTTCPVRHVRCADCMVTALTAVPLAPRETPRPVLAEVRSEAGAGAGGAADRAAEASAPPQLALDRAERHAVSVLLGAGLVTVQEANAARAVPDETPAPTGAAEHGAGSRPGSHAGSYSGSHSGRPSAPHGGSRSARATRAAG
jgi:hypothetical protein